MSSIKMGIRDAQTPIMPAPPNIFLRSLLKRILPHRILPSLSKSQSTIPRSNIQYLQTQHTSTPQATKNPQISHQAFMILCSLLLCSPLDANKWLLPYRTNFQTFNPTQRICSSLLPFIKVPTVLFELFHAVETVVLESSSPAISPLPIFQDSDTTNHAYPIFKPPSKPPSFSAPQIRRRSSPPPTPPKSTTTSPSRVLLGKNINPQPSTLNPLEKGGRPDIRPFCLRCLIYIEVLGMCRRYRLDVGGGGLRLVDFVQRGGMDLGDRVFWMGEGGLR